MIGRAAMVIIDLESPDKHGAMWAVFEEAPGDEPREHPIAKARALWESTKYDWPTHTLAIAANSRAENLRSAEAERQNPSGAA